MRIGPIIIVIWLVIGAIAAGQRGYYSGPVANCTKGATIAITIIAGPLNYVGINPRIACTGLKPSQ